MNTKRLARALVPLALLLPLATACGGPAGADDASDGTVTVTVGYQSKTINTVTAGTLLRSLGYFEEELAERGRKDGVRYRVQWQDYATGAPITAQMTAGKIDIGSMGDFPLLLNAARGRQLGEPTRLVSVTGYNLRGGLNTVVTAPGSGLRTLADLKGKRVSTSVGSAADGTLVRALRRAGLDPAKDVSKLNQQPSVGASALAGGSVDALSQFVAWPGLLAFQGKAEALYDGAELDLPTFHGVTVREEFARERADVLDAFLRAQRRATDRLRSAPVESAESVAKETGLPAEVVYLYNGAQGIATFDPALRPELLAALKEDVPVLREAGLVKDVDVDAFVDPAPLRRAVTAAGYPRAGAAKAELWLRGRSATRSFGTAGELLAAVAAARPGTVRAAYVPDAVTGTLWFADRAVWVADGGSWRAFVTRAAADRWLAGHPGARVVAYADAVRAAGS
ncbi:ABC transporter substrate-binding protein [Streptomyces hydrogenans]|uniref:Nitrate ABC transporter, periplasmic protein n=2 Tax=Streptomyces hydrogenans TaxID=1873719 RepID=A0ABQ3PM00_9ACTN|nr:ABC transporter substrate-binding protein [Streptomyces hydrogenans]GHE30062.1 putative nitrate ABC transporter, periplasmic protein [Streptomyces hydrogenans]GHI26036.1 putative nitrate ABC transporter, periplasmic protein [Streptomyces hydrogenans]